MFLLIVTCKDKLLQPTTSLTPLGSRVDICVGCIGENHDSWLEEVLAHILESI